MGCWNGTCMISNLPITAGERIKVVILTGSGSVNHTSGYYYGSDILPPAFLPITGVYDDYGGIEKIEHDWNTEIIINHFKSFMGDEIIVDNEKVKDYTLEHILKGIERNDLRYTGVSPHDRKNIKLARSIAKDTPENDLPDWVKEYLKIDLTPSERRLNISWVMIREDVWNHILENYKGEFYNSDSKGVDDPNFYLTAKEWCRKEFDKKSSFAKEINGLIGSIHGGVFSGSYAGDFRLLCAKDYEKFLIRNLEDDTVREDIFKQWSELRIVDSYLGGVRKGWMIQPGKGSQSECYEDAKILAEKIIEICNEKLEEYEDE